MLSEAESLRGDGDKLVADLVPRDVAQQEFSCHKKMKTINTNTQKRSQKNIKKWQKGKILDIFRSHVIIDHIMLFSNKVPGPRLLELSFLVHHTFWFFFWFDEEYRIV